MTLFDLDLLPSKSGLFGGLSVFLRDPIERASLIFDPGDMPRIRLPER